MQDSRDLLTESGDREEFVLLFSRERRRIFAFTCSLVPVIADAEDIFQHASLVLWRRFPDYDPGQDFFRWACGIVKYTVLNYRRSKQRSKVYFSETLIQILAEERIESGAKDNERMDALQQCLSRLKEKDRSLIARVYGDELPIRDAAVKLGMSLHSTYNRLSIIRKRLRKCINTRLGPINPGELC